MTITANVKASGNDVSITDSQTGEDLLKLVPVDAITVHITPHDRQVTLAVSPWAFAYDVAPATVTWTVKGERIRAVVIGDDVASRIVPIEDVVRGMQDGK